LSFENCKITVVDFSFSKEKPEVLFNPSVTKLVLAGCHWLNDEELNEIGGTLYDFNASLEYLSLYWCVNITDNGLISFLKRQRHLKCLILAGCKNLTDAAITEGVCVYSLQLEELDLTRLPLLTDLSIQRVGNSLSGSLKVLNLYATTQISDYDGLTKLQKLERLDFCGHVNLSNEQCSEIIRNAPHLNRINLTWCKNINILTMEQLIRLDRIVSLSLFGLCEIPAYLIRDLVQKHKNSLEELDIRGIPSVRDLTENDCIRLRSIAVNLKKWKLAG
jgi:Leucine Rich repeat